MWALVLPALFNLSIIREIGDTSGFMMRGSLRSVAMQRFHCTSFLFQLTSQFGERATVFVQDRSTCDP